MSSRHCRHGVQSALVLALATGCGSVVTLPGGPGTGGAGAAGVGNVSSSAYGHAATQTVGVGPGYGGSYSNGSWTTGVTTGWTTGVGPSTAAATSTGTSWTTSTVGVSTGAGGCWPYWAWECAKAPYNTCASLQANCFSNGACQQVLSCWDCCTPDDLKCRQACMGTYESGASAAALLVDCGATASPSCGPILSQCSKCLYAECSGAMNLCFGNGACVNLRGCLESCGPDNVSCADQCYTNYGMGVMNLQYVNDCKDQNCAQVCGAQ